MKTLSKTPMADLIAPNTMGHILATYDPSHVPSDMSAQLTASTMKQVLKAHRRAAFKARVLSVWWAPLRTARYLLRLFTD